MSSECVDCFGGSVIIKANRIWFCILETDICKATDTVAGSLPLSNAVNPDKVTVNNTSVLK